MSAIKAVLQKNYPKESFEEVDDVEELVLDSLEKNLKELSAQDKEFLESFTGLKYLSMAEIGLEKLTNFPTLSNLVMVILCSHKNVNDDFVSWT